MRYIQNIEFLNGLPVEKKLLTVPQSEYDEKSEKSMEEVIEEPSKEEEDSQGQINDLESSGSEF